MYPDHLPLRPDLRDAHSPSWQAIAQPGAFWSGSDRVDMVREARAALSCSLCSARKSALSPNAVSGVHDAATGNFDLQVIDAIHRIRTDPGRLTLTWFNELMASGLSQQHYVEMVAVVNSSVIIDTLHQSLGLPLAPLPQPVDGKPSGEYNTDAIDDGAWLPILAARQDVSATGLPTVPNIARSMGLVPSAGALFFTTFRPHYALMDIPLSISQAQAEFVASRVSALNQCFY